MTRLRRLARPLRRSRRGVRIEPESLEGRALLSGLGVSDAIEPAVASIIADQGWSRGGSSGGGLTNPSPSRAALTPGQIQTAYDFGASSTAGAGTTIAIVDAYNDPNIQADLAAFDAYYKLPAASLTVLNQNGQKTNLPATDPNWSLEISLDVEWAHVAAPGAKIVLVEANSASLSDLTTAVQTAAQSANVVSMSWGSGEFNGEQTFDSAAYFANPNVTFVAAAGDDGGAGGAEWPASSPDVLAVGGTTLTTTGSGAYAGETAWNASWSWGRGGFNFTGGSGGVSQIESLPSFQASALGANYASGRAVPDVSMDANPSTGVAVYDSVPGLSQSGWFQVGGTSAGSPIWSGLVTDADQARAAAKLAPLSSTQTLNTLYGLYASSASYSADFHDVTSGGNFAGAASTGYDLATGLGSPVAAAIIYAAAHPSATPSVSLSALAPQTVVAAGYGHGAGPHDQSASATDSSATLTSAAEIRFVISALASLPAPPASVEVAPPVHTAGVDVEAPGASGLPNQSPPVSLRVGAASSRYGGEVVMVREGLDLIDDSSAPAPRAPEPGDFPSPPRLDPSTPISVWDEALAGLYDGLDEPSSLPPAPAPGAAPTAGEEDVADATPRFGMLGAAGLALVVGMSWSRRLAEEDRRFRTVGLTSPSLN